jgi:very-short-patch-repair endonuclease
MKRSRNNKPSPLAGEGGAHRSRIYPRSKRKLSKSAIADLECAPGEGAKLRFTRARAMRSAMTDAERKLWLALRDRRLKGKFRRQVPVGPFIADFVSYEYRLVIEVDGGQHANATSDDRRDRWFAVNNFKVIRFWNNDVLSNLDGVLETITATLDATAPHPALASRGHPSPARGEGKREIAR